MTAADPQVRESSFDFSDTRIREQRDRILAHELFQKAHLSRAFLRYVIDRTLAGEASALKESVIGREVFGRGSSFDPQIDNVVRVNANRLRSRLAEYYLGSGRNDELIIDMPRGGYTPVFRIAPASQTATTSPVRLTHTCVGRELELRQLRSGWEKIARGVRQCVTISGDAGLGKSTLVEVFLESVAASSWIMKGRCSEKLSGNEAYVAVLESLDTLSIGDSSEEIIAFMNEHSPSWLAQVLPGKAIPSAVAAVPSQERMRREFARFVQALCRLRPVILFFDDMHWADPSTCELLSYLARVEADLRLLLVFTFRPAQLTSPDHPFRRLHVELARQHSSEISLSPLGLSAVEEYIQRSFPANSFPANLAQILFERTEGHPLFLSDVVNHVFQSGFVSEATGRWEMLIPPEGLRSVVPATTQRMISLQIDQLTASRRQMLECAAVQGPKFDAVIIADALHLSVDAVDEELQQLEKERCFVSSEHEQEDTPPNELFSYRFTHILYQNEFDRGLSRLRRATLARALANALVRHHGDNAGSHAAGIAALFATGGEPDEASAYFLLAAGNAARLFAFPEVVALACRGLAALKKTPESSHRDTRELSLTILLGMAEMATLGYAAPEVDRTHRRARDLCLKLGEFQPLVRMLWRLHTCLVNAGNLKEALKLSDEMLAQSAKVGGGNALVEALHAQASTLSFMGRLQESEAQFRRIFEVAPIENHHFDTSLYVLDPCVTSLSLLARLIAVKGDFHDAMQKAELSLRLASDLAHPPSVTYAKWWIGFISHLRGDYQRAITSVEDVMYSAKSQGLPQFVEWARIVFGSSLAALGQEEEGICQMEQSLASQLQMRSLVERPYCLNLLAEAVLRKGDPERAAQICTKALAISDETEARSFEVESRRIRAEAWFALKRIPEATTECECALSVARATGCGALQARAALTLNRLYNS